MDVSEVLVSPILDSIGEGKENNLWRKQGEGANEVGEALKEKGGLQHGTE